MVSYVNELLLGFTKYLRIFSLVMHSNNNSNKAVVHDKLSMHRNLHLRPSHQKTFSQQCLVRNVVAWFCPVSDHVASLNRYGSFKVYSFVFFVMTRNSLQLIPTRFMHWLVILEEDTTLCNLITVALYKPGVLAKSVWVVKWVVHGDTIVCPICIHCTRWLLSHWVPISLVVLGFSSSYLFRLMPPSYSTNPFRQWWRQIAILNSKQTISTSLLKVI